MSRDPEDSNDEKNFNYVYRRETARRCRRLVIAVHGMGDQIRNDMARQIAALFATALTRNNGGRGNQAIHLPLGLWEGTDPSDPVTDDIIAYAPTNPELNELAFAEIHWADLAREAEKAGYRLEDAPQWASSVVDRLRQRHDLRKGFQQNLALGATVVEEVGKSVDILRRILFLADKAGIFSFDLGKILAQYLGDVQQVADFRFVRKIFRKRFQNRMAYLADKSKAEEIHFVAHSEGTVVLLRALLGALNNRNSESPDGPAWIHRVRSLTTIGSPIDKHLILWPEMWGWLSQGEEEVAAAESEDERRRLLEERRSHWHALEHKIRWRNYYDFADPVGYDLETAREKLGLWGCEAFDFKPEDDHGFRRYPLPGKAHVDYFKDPTLFQQIHDEAIKGEKHPGQPKSRWRALPSPYLPYLVAVALHLAAVALLHHTMIESRSGSPDAGLPMTQTTLGWLPTLPGIVISGLVLFGVTVCSRVWVISLNWLHRLMATLFYLATLVLLGVASPESDTIKWIGVPSVALVGLGLGIHFVSRVGGKAPLWAMRWQIVAGGGAVGVAALCLLRSPSAPFLTAVLGAMLFLYTWWLGMLLFDLSYVWRTYINTSKRMTFVHRLRRMLSE